MLFKKSHAKFALILSPFLLAAGLRAQVVSSVRIFTVPSGLQFSVDGKPFQQPATLLWPQGSKHTITLPTLQASGQPKTQYGFGSAVTNLAPITNLNSITADPGLTFIQLN